MSHSSSAEQNSIVSSSGIEQPSLQIPGTLNPYLDHEDDAAALLVRDIKPPTFLLDDILAAGHEGEGGTVAFLSGNPSVGKTYAALQLLYAVALGEPWFGIATKEGRAGGIFLETPAWQLQERLKAISDGSLPPGRVFFQTAADLKMDSIDVCNSKHQRWIIEWTKARGLVLLAIDPFAFLHQLDENDTSQAIRIGDGLKLIARETGAAVLVLDHYRKRAPGTGSEDVSQALRGSIAKSAWAGAVMGMDMKRGVVRLGFGKVAARAEPDPVFLNRDPETGVLTVTEAPESQNEEKEKKLRLLGEFVADGSLYTAKEMGDHVDLKANTVQRNYVPLLGMVQVGKGRNAKYQRFPDPSMNPRSVRDSTQVTASNGVETQPGAY